MFEKITSVILNKYLKEYIKDFDPKKLKLGVLSGSIELKNLELKKTALDGLDVPLSLFKGTIDLIKIKVPWSNLKGESTIVEVNNIFIVAVPRNKQDV